MEGRIEILYYGIWGTVCDTNFDLDSANVACRRLGFPGAARVLRSVDGGSGQIWLNNVQCVGNETGLEYCPHEGFGNVPYYCNHYDDVGVECLRKFIPSIHNGLHYVIHLCSKYSHNQYLHVCRYVCIYIHTCIHMV